MRVMMTSALAERLGAVLRNAASPEEVEGIGRRVGAESEREGSYRWEDPSVKVWLLFGGRQTEGILETPSLLSSGGSHSWRVSKSRTVVLGWKVVS
jgi:hypothetical protein